MCVCVCVCVCVCAGCGVGIGCFGFVAVVEIKKRTLLWPYTFIKVTKSCMNKLSE